MILPIILSKIIICTLICQSGSVLVDSSGNGYTLWNQSRECISYNPAPDIDALIIVNRAYNPTGKLNTHEAPGDLSAWVHYDPYQQTFGPARYPTTYAGYPWPFIAFTWLLGSSFGGYGGMCEYIAGWFTCDWEVLRDFGFFGDLVILKQLPDTNVLAVCKHMDTSLKYILFDPVLNPLDTGTIAVNATYWGYDINGGIAMVFYYDSLNNLCYKTTTDGTNWSPEYTWDLAFTPPYPNDSLTFTQMALTDNGQPLLVFECRNLDDNTYPYYGKIYVSYASGVPPVELTYPLPDTEATYPTIATGGNKAVVIFNIPRNDLPDSLTWMDIFMCTSTDNGITWSDPINITSTSIHRIGLQQVAKRIDTLRNRIYYVFARDKVIDHDPLWHILYDSLGLDPMYIYLGYSQITGIEEGERLKVEGEGLKLMVLPSVVRRDNAQIQYAIPERQRIRLDLYDVLGRKVKTIKEGIVDAGVYSYRLDSSNLTSGVYYIILQGERESKRGKILIVK
ncbi:MAG: hypothetical protein ABIL39_11230 [candidate division WOR-3 bacterium]